VSLEVNCPSCGATVAFRSTGSVVAICAYCKSTLVRHDLDLENVGRMADLKADGSPLQLGSAGAYAGVHFAVVGRIQYRFDAGLWNEWHLLFDDLRDGWLGEARGNYAVSFRTAVNEALPAFGTLKVGEPVVLGGHGYEVIDIERARCIAGEGELPFRVEAGYDAPVADLQGAGRRFATLDYSETPPLLFVGQYVEFDALGLTGLRALDGW